jgi:hypothetical protein
VALLMRSPYLRPKRHTFSLLLQIACEGLASHAAANWAEASAQLHVVQRFLVDIDNNGHHGG